MTALKHRRRAWQVIGGIALILTVAIGVVWFLLASQQAPSNQNTNTPQQPPPTKNALQFTEALPDALLIGQKIMIAVYDEQSKAIQPIVASKNLNGVIIMDEMSAQSVASLSRGSTIAPTIAVDQEGGTVQRYKNEGVLPGAEDVANTLSPKEAYSAYQKDAQFLKSQGITTNFAPVVDVMSITPSPLPGRMYSSNPTTVTTYATQMIRASQQEGITPVIKHFPGLGSASGNTDYGSATTDSFATLKTRDLLPYQSLAELHPDVMVSNAVVPRLTNGQPAIWSADALALLRSYGYNNAVVYTDSLTAKAIPGTLDQAALKAWQAGVDVAVIVQTKQQLNEINSDVATIITRATSALQSGQLSKESVTQSVQRILARKGINPCSIQ
jgi:beta-N-acetylhexosaminidase